MLSSVAFFFLVAFDFLAIALRSLSDEPAYRRSCIQCCVSASVVLVVRRQYVGHSARIRNNNLESVTLMAVPKCGQTPLDHGREGITSDKVDKRSRLDCACQMNVSEGLLRTGQDFRSRQSVRNSPEQRLRAQGLGLTRRVPRRSPPQMLLWRLSPVRAVSS